MARNRKFGNIIVNIPAENLGDCAMCLRKPARHEVLTPLSTPIPANPTLGFPEVKAIREYVCDDCLPKHIAR